MASIFGHVASVLGFHKLFPDSWIDKKVLLLGVVTSMLPDIDVISERFGITAYDTYDALGHRGLTHSISFALVWSILVYFFFNRKDKTPTKYLIAFYFLCGISHGILDAMTTGGDGISFFYPFSDMRSFLPIRVIQVSPIGISSFFSEWGISVLVSELKYIGIPAFLMYVTGIILNRKVYPGK